MSDFVLKTFLWMQHYSLCHLMYGSADMNLQVATLLKELDLL
jgi:hypothetical protein